MKTGYTAEQAAALLLQDKGLSEYQVGFLAVALDEVANWRGHASQGNSISCHECANELTQMNSQHQSSIEPVVYAMTGLSFSISWHGAAWPYGTRRFFIDQHEHRELMPRADFDALHDDYGWGSDAHRHAIRMQLNA